MTVYIEGMKCIRCEAAVKKALEALDFVKSAQVSHESGKAVLELSGAADETALKNAVEEADFVFKGLE